MAEKVLQELRRFYKDCETPIPDGEVLLYKLLRSFIRGPYFSYNEAILYGVRIPYIKCKDPT